MKLNDWLRYIVLSGIFIIPFIPFIVLNSMFFPFITGKGFAFRIIIALIFAAWGWLALRDSRYLPKFSWLFIFLSLFTVSIGISDLLGINPSKSIWSNYERMEGWVTLAHLFIYFVITTTVLNTEKLWVRLFQTSIGASILMTMYGFMQLGGAAVINQGGVRVDGRFGNATYLAIYAVFHIFLALLLAVRHLRHRKGIEWMYVYVVAALLNLVILYHTATRGAILGLIGGFLLAAFIAALAHRDSARVRVVSAGVLLGVVALVGTFWVSRDSEAVKTSPVLSRFATISLEDNTTKSRFLIWNMAWKGFKERPIFGWGQENFNYVFNTNYDPGMYGQEQWFDRAHNIFFDWLIAGGIMGILLYGALYGSALYLLWRKKADDFSPAEKSILTGLLAAYLFHNIFVFDNLVSYIMFFMVLGYIHFRSGHPAITVHHPLQTSPLRQSLAPVAAILILVAAYMTNARPLMANVTLIDALYVGADTKEGFKFFYPEGAKKNMELFSKVFSYGSLGTPEAREQFLSTFYILNKPSVATEVKNEYYLAAVKEMENQIKATPLDARPYVILGSFLSQTGQTDAAIVHFEKARELSPRKQPILLQLAEMYFMKNDAVRALEYAKQAYELDTSFAEPALIYASIAIRTGEKEVAEGILGKLDPSMRYDMRLIPVYLAEKNYEKIIELFAFQVKQDPKNLQKRLSLAAAYLEAGQRTKAVVVIEEIIAMDPTFKEQGNYLIKEIRAGRNP